MSDALLRRLLKEAQASFGCNAEPILTRYEKIECPYSNVNRLELECDGATRVLYLKHVKPDSIGVEAARHRVAVEHQILRQLSEQFQSHPTCGVARPIAVFPDECAIATEEVRGVALAGLIGRGATRYMFGVRQALLEKYCALAGTWLREFQSLTTRNAAAFNFDGLLRYCDQRIDTLLEDHGSGIDRRFKAKFAGYLRARRAELNGKADIIVGRHNDFSPHNIIVSGERVSVIDFGFFDHDSYMYDLCRFWFQLECMRSSPLFSPSMIGYLQASFFEGYGMRLQPADPAFEMVASRFFVTRLATMVKEGTRRGVKGWIDRKSYSWCLGWLTDRCEGY